MLRHNKNIFCEECGEQYCGESVRTGTAIWIKVNFCTTCGTKLNKPPTEDIKVTLEICVKIFKEDWDNYRDKLIEEIEEDGKYGTVMSLKKEKYDEEKQSEIEAKIEKDK